MIQVSILIPFLNESENLPLLRDQLDDFAKTYPLLEPEFIFIDDGSTDDSFSVLSVMKFRSPVKIIRLARNYGSHSALRAGLLHTSGVFVTLIPADLQFPLPLINEMYQHCLQGNDAVWAVRETVEMGIFERRFSAMYARMMQKYAIKDYPEKGIESVMFNQKVRSEMNRQIEHNSSFFLQILNLGFRQTQIPCHRAARAKGKSKWTINKKIKLFVDSFIAFSYAPIRFVTMAGIIFSVIGFLWTLYIVFRTLLFDNLSPGWPALMSILLIGFGITNFSLGIVAEYLWRTLDSSRKRPVFIIDEIVELH